MAGYISNDLRNKILGLNREGYSTYEIAKELNIPEAVVIKVLKPRA